MNKSSSSAKCEDCRYVMNTHVEAECWRMVIEYGDTDIRKCSYERTAKYKGCCGPEAKFFDRR
jgi:hypothetical protein